MFLTSRALEHLTRASALCSTGQHFVAYLGSSVQDNAEDREVHTMVNRQHPIVNIIMDKLMTATVVDEQMTHPCGPLPPSLLAYPCWGLGLAGGSGEDAWCTVLGVPGDC